MATTEVERKYLRRLQAGVICENDRYIKSALPTLKRMLAHGWVRRVDVYGDEVPADAPINPDACWEMTEAGEAEAAR